jgi:hypothetical protein
LTPVKRFRATASATWRARLGVARDYIAEELTQGLTLGRVLVATQERRKPYLRNVTARKTVRFVLHDQTP